MQNIERWRKDTRGRCNELNANRWLYQLVSGMQYTSRALSQAQGRRYHSDIQHIYIPHDRPPARSDSRTTGPVKRFDDTSCTCSSSERYISEHVRTMLRGLIGHARHASPRTLFDRNERGSRPRLPRKIARRMKVVLTVFPTILCDWFSIVFASSPFHLDRCVIDAYWLPFVATLLTLPPFSYLEFAPFVKDRLDTIRRGWLQTRRSHLRRATRVVSSCVSAED